MDREKADKILNVYGRPSFKAGNTRVSFSRQDSSNIQEIEEMSDEDLESQWKSLVFMNHIYGQVSLNDLQRINLFELEMSSRDSFNGKEEEFQEWYKTSEKELNEQIEKDEQEGGVE